MSSLWHVQNEPFPNLTWVYCLGHSFGAFNFLTESKGDGFMEHGGCIVSFALRTFDWESVWRKYPSCTNPKLTAALGVECLVTCMWRALVTWYVVYWSRYCSASYIIFIIFLFPSAFAQNFALILIICEVGSAVLVSIINYTDFQHKLWVECLPDLAHTVVSECRSYDSYYCQSYPRPALLEIGREKQRVSRKAYTRG